jgi:hypothetical protein
MLKYFYIVFVLKQKLFEIQQATFRIKVKAHWNSSGHVDILDSTLEPETMDDDEKSEDENEEIGLDSTLSVVAVV